MIKKMIKIKTKFGQVLTITISEQTEEYITGFDKYGIFTKVLITDIESCSPFTEEVYLR